LIRIPLLDGQALWIDFPLDPELHGQLGLLGLRRLAQHGRLAARCFGRTLVPCTRIPRLEAHRFIPIDLPVRNIDSRARLCKHDIDGDAKH
jgi:hypothetical protein